MHLIAIVVMSNLCKEYQNVHELFLKWSDDVSTLLAGKGLEIHDKIFQQLRHNSDDKEMLSELLQILCKSFSLVLERLLGDHLKGGTYGGMPATELDEETKAVPKTNCQSEQDFAVLDR